MLHNGPQLASPMRHLRRNYRFTHVTSSSLNARANGEVECAVRTAKDILKKNDDSLLGLLSYGTSSLQNGLAPCELLMSRQLPIQLPVLSQTLQPRLQMKELVSLKVKEEAYRPNQQFAHDKRYHVKELPELQRGKKMWVRDQDRMGKVLSPAASPSS